MTFFTLGHHHDFAVMELGQHGPSPDRHTAGLAHVAFKIGDTLEAYDAVKRELEAAGVVILFELDHICTKGMHMHDPDRNEVELFVDMPPRPPDEPVTAALKRVRACSPWLAGSSMSTSTSSSWRSSYGAVPHCAVNRSSSADRRILPLPAKS